VAIGVPAYLVGAPLRASRKPERKELIPFGHPPGLLKEERTLLPFSRSRVLSKTAGAGFSGLIAKACTDG
jgi:hypothetical protein